MSPYLNLNKRQFFDSFLPGLPQLIFNPCYLTSISTFHPNHFHPFTSHYSLHCCSGTLWAFLRIMPDDFGAFHPFITHECFVWKKVVVVVKLRLLLELYVNCAREKRKELLMVRKKNRQFSNPFLLFALHFHSKNISSSILWCYYMRECVFPLQYNTNMHVHGTERFVGGLKHERGGDWRFCYCAKNET